MADADAISTPPPSNAARSLLPDPSAIFSVLLRRLWLFLSVFALVVGVCAAYTLRKVPLYVATSTLVLEPQKPAVVQVGDDAGQAPSDINFVETEVQILSSPALAGRVVRSLHLERYPEYRLPPGAVLDAQDDPGLNPLARRLLGHIVVQRVGTSYVIAISANSADRELAALIANEFPRQYLAQQTESKNGTARNISQILQGRLRAMQDQVVASDAAVQRYKIQHGLMSTQGSTMAEQEVSSLNGEIAKARAEHADHLARLAAAREQLAHGGGGADIGAALGSATVSSLRAQEAATSQRLADLTTRYGERYPDVQKTREELADTHAQIQREINRIISNLSAEAQASGSRLASLSGSKSSAAGSLAANNTAEVGLLELERKAEANRAIYNAFLNRSKETMSQEGLVQPNARIDALARVPSLPYSPNVPLAIALALVAGLISGVSCVVLAEYLDRRIRTKQDVERKLRVRYAGAVPELSSTLSGMRNAETPQDYLLSHPYSTFAEAFRSLRATLLLHGGTPPKVIAITSALPREGKSTTSICLARTMVNSGSRTVLVDCDIRRRSTSELLLKDGKSGLLDLLRGKATLDEALEKDPSTDLMVLGCTVDPGSARDLTADMPIEQFLGMLRERFDVVILDTAPILGIAETRAIAAASDTVLMLARWAGTSVKAADAAIDMLLGAHVKLRGLALNLVDIRKYASTGEEDVYSYQKRFKSYYQN